MVRCISLPGGTCRPSTPCTSTRRPERVTLRHRGAGFAADIFVVFELQALEPFRVSADKADHLAGQLALRIMAIGLIKHADAVGVQCLNFFRLR